MNRLKSGIMCLAAAALCCGSAMAAGTKNKAADVEPNNTVATATPIIFGELGRVVTFRANMGASDTDIFKVTVPGAIGSNMLVFITTPIAGSTANPFQSPDTLVQILDSGGNPATGLDDDSGGGTGTQRGSIARTTMPAAGGTVYFKVTDFLGATTGDYMVTVAWVLGSDFDFDESGSNNTAAAADVLDLALGGPLLGFGSFSSAADVDFYAVDMNAGDSLVVCPNPISATWTGPDTTVDIIAPDGTSVLATNDDDGCDAIQPAVTSRGSLVRFMAATAGRYYVRLSTSSTGDYSCIFSLIPGATGVCTGDANGDGQVNFNDILSILANFNVVCP